jgi:hypothetical protein
MCNHVTWLLFVWMLAGTLPAEYALLQTPPFTSLQLQNNSLTGTIPDVWQNKTSSSAASGWDMINLSGNRWGMGCCLSCSAHALTWTFDVDAVASNMQCTHSH